MVAAHGVWHGGLPGACEGSLAQSAVADGPGTAAQSNTATIRWSALDGFVRFVCPPLYDTTIVHQGNVEG